MIHLELDLDSANGIRQTGRVISLDYDDVPFVRQPFATKTESVTPFLINYFGGTILLTPSSDVWMDQVVLDAKKESQTTYSQTSEQVKKGGWDPDTGYSPVVWGGWKTTWTGGGGSTKISSNSSTHWGGWQNRSGYRERSKYRTTTTTFRRNPTKIKQKREAKRSGKIKSNKPNKGLEAAKAVLSILYNGPKKK